jgi:hypothetical protein|eukprot:COSAG06_NODE_37314_length_436_cov_3.759644_2_plen_56_part_00
MVWYGFQVSCLPVGYIEMIMEANAEDTGGSLGGEGGTGGVRGLKVLRMLRLAKSA